MLTELYRVPTPEWKTMQWLLDSDTYRLANELGIPRRETWYVQDAGDLEQIPTTFPSPLSRP